MYCRMLFESTSVLRLFERISNPSLDLFQDILGELSCSSVVHHYPLNNDPRWKQENSLSEMLQRTLCWLVLSMNISDHWDYFGDVGLLHKCILKGSCLNFKWSVVANMIGLQGLLVLSLCSYGISAKGSKNCGITKPFQKIEVLVDLAEKEECIYYAEEYTRTKIEAEVMACEFKVVCENISY